MNKKPTAQKRSDEVIAEDTLEDFTKVGLLQTFLYYVAGLAKLDGSREWLEAHPAELEVLERAFRATKGN